LDENEEFNWKAYKTSKQDILLVPLVLVLPDKPLPLFREVLQVWIHCAIILVKLHYLGVSERPYNQVENSV